MLKLSLHSTTPSLAKQLGAISDEMAKAATDAMVDATNYLKEQYRDQVKEAGMGTRMATTWRSEVYPRRFGKNSLSPAGEVFSNAPLIIDAFSRGATIRPSHGAQWLWIPTKNVPRAKAGGGYTSSLSRKRGRGRGAAMGPEEVELHFNTEMHVYFRNGKGYAYLSLVRGMNRSGYREATKGRLKGRKNVPARAARPILMFVLVKGVKPPRLFDLAAPLRSTQRYLASAMENRLSRI